MMANKRWGFIYAPNARSRAYLSLFAELNIIPAVIVQLKGDFRESAQLSAESARFGYGRFFDVDYTLETFLTQFSPELRRVPTTRLSDSSAFDALRPGGVDAWIFGGGGIVPRSYFDTIAPILHVHPGILPDYRGSTCWYYSYLKERKVGATAFWMDPEIDNGKVIVTRSFRVNMSLECTQPLFLDHILDPYIRRCVLREALQTEELDERSESEGNCPMGEAYFVAHPWVRYLMKRRLQEDFDAGSASGIL